MADVEPVHFREEVLQIISKVITSFEYSNMRLHSGAGHDAQLIHHICPTGMIFIPSIGGVSHSPKEESLVSDITKGANVLLNSVLEIARIT